MEYFNQALFWAMQYNIAAILAKSNIIPDNEKSYKLSDINAAVKRVLNKNPSINCYRATNEQYLNEIRLCFNRQMELIDCDGMASTNCLNKPIYYPIDSDDGTSGWFIFLGICGIALFVLLIAKLVRSERHRFNEWISFDKL